VCSLALLPLCRSYVLTTVCMLFRDEVLKGILRGEVTLAFRRWRRPTVRSGGTLLTQRGVLSIDEVRSIEARELSNSEAQLAGFADRQTLMQSLRGEGSLYRIAVSYQGPDTRDVLRSTLPTTQDELDPIVNKLRAMDRRAVRGPWTQETLALLRDRPDVRAADLAASLGLETAPFKADVRKLKTLGLTLSLEVGYELSARGAHVLRVLES